jgi:very-short-patch-repair endonuclease
MPKKCDKSGSDAVIARERDNRSLRGRFPLESARLIVEVDGWQSHGTRSAFEEDHARDARLKMLGYEVIRFTWRQIKEDGAGVVRTVRVLLGARAT